jgi:hypothetical protein
VKGLYIALDQGWATPGQWAGSGRETHLEWPAWAREDQLRNGNAYHFNTLLNCGNFDHTSCPNEIKRLSAEFASRFEDFRKQEIYLDLLSSPFSIDVDRAPLSLQMELIKLQENSELKIKFKDTLLLEFYQKYYQKQKYPQLSAVIRIVLAQFGSTYCCEQFFF